jgi:hypothetical protein
MACILGRTAEIFFPKLDMKNDLINCADIFPVLLREYGYEPVIFGSEEEAKKNMHLVKEGKYPVYIFKTDTSGEKLYEEFYTDTETFELEKFHALGVISKKPTYSVYEMDNIDNQLKELFAKPDTAKADIVAWLKTYIPEFDHIETGLNLDRKM